jgi:GMP synthase (glutamine-hydrolysing)
LIARRVREAHVYCELHPFDVEDAFIRKFEPHGIILSGGPASVTEGDTPRAPESVFKLGVPVLGICYGMQTMAAQLGGAVEQGDPRIWLCRGTCAGTVFRDIQDRTKRGHGLPMSG